MADPYIHSISITDTIPGETYARLKDGRKIIGVVEQNLRGDLFAGELINRHEYVLSKKQPIAVYMAVSNQVYRYKGILGKISPHGRFTPIDAYEARHDWSYPPDDAVVFLDDRYPFPTPPGNPIPGEFKDICLESIHYSTVLRFLGDTRFGREYFGRPENMLFVYNEGMGEFFNPTPEKLSGFAHDNLYMLNGLPTPFYKLSFCKVKFVPNNAPGGASAPVVAAGGAGASAPVVVAGGAGASAGAAAPVVRNPNEILPSDFGDNEIRGGSRQTRKKQKKSKKRKTNKK